MFTYNINIYEKNVVTSVKVDSLSYTLKLDESLDSGVLTIPRSARRDKFNRFSRVEISINDGDTTKDTTWLIYTTKVEIDSKGSEKTYNHTIGLIEPTKWLEKFVVGTLTFTQPISGTQKTLYDYVERVRQLVPFVSRDKVSSTRLFKLDTNFANGIKETIAPQIYLDKKNLRETLIELFKVVNAIPRLYYDNGWVLTGDYINQKQMPITIGDGDIDYVQEASGENFAQSIEVFHENTMTEKPMYEGSITDFISFRNNSVILGDNDLRLILNEKVSKMVKLEMLYVQNFDDVVTTFDISKVLFEKNVYDTIEFAGGDGYQTQEYSLYWTYKSNEILGFSETFNAVFQQIVIEKIGDLINVDSALDYKNFAFRVEYIPYFETMRSIQYREDSTPYALRPEMLDQYSGLIVNQSERINELYDLTSNVYGQIQRLGVDTVSISKKHYLLSNIYNIGDYTKDGYIVTKIEVIPYTTYLIARYELSKNWNRIAQFIQLDKEFRPYEVSLTKTALTLKRDILFMIGMVEISNEPSLKPTSEYDSIKSIFMNTLKSGVYDTFISLLKFNNDNSYNSVIKPLAPLAEKNMLKWKANFGDTKLAGKRVVNEGTIERKIQKQVNYTNANGTINDVKLKLFNGVWTYYNLDEGNYYYNYNVIRDLAEKLPLDEPTYNIITDANLTSKRYLDIPKENLYATALDFPSGGASGYVVALDEMYVYQYIESYIYHSRVIAMKQEPIFELPEYQILKDGAEVLGLELYLPLFPKETMVSNYIIGDSLLKENNLIKIKETSSALYFYGLSYEISKAKTDKINLTYATQIVAVDPYLNDSYIEVPISVYDLYDYYAIADEDGNLYLGVNQKIGQGTKQDISTIYFNFIGERAIYGDKNLTSYATLTLDATFITSILEALRATATLSLDSSFISTIITPKQIMSNVTLTLDSIFTSTVITPKTLLSNAVLTLGSTFVSTVIKPKEFISQANLILNATMTTGVAKPYDIIASGALTLNVSFNVSVNSGTEYNITYYLGGTTENPATNNLYNPATFYSENLPIWLYGPTRSGYSFDGWYRNASFTGDRVTSIQTPANITLYAKWVSSTKTWVSSNESLWNLNGVGTNVSNNYPYPDVSADNYNVGDVIRVSDADMLDPTYTYWEVELQ